MPNTTKSPNIYSGHNVMMKQLGVVQAMSISIKFLEPTLIEVSDGVSE